jgi:hypothetical protein
MELSTISHSSIRLKIAGSSFQLKIKGKTVGFTEYDLRN